MLFSKVVAPSCKWLSFPRSIPYRQSLTNNIPKQFMKYAEPLWTRLLSGSSTALNSGNTMNESGSYPQEACIPVRRPDESAQWVCSSVTIAMRTPPREPGTTPRGSNVQSRKSARRHPAPSEPPQAVTQWSLVTEALVLSHLTCKQIICLLTLFPICNQTENSPAVAYRWKADCEVRRNVTKFESCYLLWLRANYTLWSLVSIFEKNKSIIYCSYLTRLLWEVKLYVTAPS